MKHEPNLLSSNDARHARKDRHTRDNNVFNVLLRPHNKGKASTKSEMNRKDLDRYKRVLLEKRGEMSVTIAGAESPIPAAGGHRGDPVDQANANTEAELQIQLHQTYARLLRAIEEAIARIRDGTFGI